MCTEAGKPTMNNRTDRRIPQSLGSIMIQSTRLRALVLLVAGLMLSLVALASSADLAGRVEVKQQTPTVEMAWGGWGFGWRILQNGMRKQHTQPRCLGYLKMTV